MKKKSFILVVLLLLVSMFTLTACQGKDGLPGDKGPAGEPGANGADGTDGRDGVDGIDATQAELRVNGNSIESKENGDWKPVISFDDLYAYSRTYSITLDPNGGTIEHSVIKNLTYKQTYTIEDEPVYETENSGSYTFVGWFNEDDEQLESTSIEIVKDLSFKAKWKGTIFFDADSLEGAKGKTFVNVEGLTDRQAIVPLKEKFITDYCAVMSYDEAKKTAIMAMNTTDLYNEFLANACHNGQILFTIEGDNCITTDFYKTYDFMFWFLLNRYNVVADFNNDPASDKYKPYVGTSSYAVRCKDMAKMLHDNDFSTMTPAWIGELNKGASDTWCAKQLAQALANFLNATGEHINGASTQKLVPFCEGLSFQDGETVTPYEPYEGLIDVMSDKVPTIVELIEDETFELPTVVKDGFVFEGWFIYDATAETDEAKWGNKVTVINKTYNGKVIAAKWTALTV
ncbi:MAG: InlB B-repeat-containing protein [Gammaproteobacteria bacterium]|nr:InlB B-repeat-containing protein [Gammaproteobacteria bacterium]